MNLLLSSIFTLSVVVAASNPIEPVNLAEESLGASDRSEAATEIPPPEFLADHTAALPAEPPPADEIRADPREELHASLLRIGAAKLVERDAAAAVIAYRQVAEDHPAEPQQIEALLGLARAYHLAGESVKSVATYEYLLHHTDPGLSTPTAYLEVGRLLRNMGSHTLALARFYSVIHTTLRLVTADLAGYRDVVQAAQFEIAETHFVMGEYAEAARLFRRFTLLNIPPPMHAAAMFRGARALRSNGDHLAAVQLLRDFIPRHADDPHLPEVYFELATLLDTMGRHEDSLRATLDLLRQQQPHHDPSGWRLWQQRTGSSLAATFYGRGDFSGALQLYRALLALDTSPAWMVPLLYQQGLCFERLLQYALARDSYSRLLATAPDSTDSSIIELQRMALWRLGQIDWWEKTQSDLHALNPGHAPPTLPPT